MKLCIVPEWLSQLLTSNGYSLDVLFDQATLESILTRRDLFFYTLANQHVHEYWGKQRHRGVNPDLLPECTGHWVRHGSWGSCSKHVEEEAMVYAEICQENPSQRFELLYGTRLNQETIPYTYEAIDLGTDRVAICVKSLENVGYSEMVEKTASNARALAKIMYNYSDLKTLKHDRFFCRALSC